MSDTNESQESSRPETGEHECLNPTGCPYHRTVNGKIRAVEIDGEKYLNADDLAQHMSNFLMLQLSMSMRDLGELDEERQAVPLHIANTLANWSGVATNLVQSIGQQDIRPLSDEGGTLISPESTKVDDTIPEDWAAPTSE